MVDERSVNGGRIVEQDLQRGGTALVARLEPNDLGWLAPNQSEFLKVCVAGDYGVTLIFGGLPNAGVIGRLKTQQADLTCTRVRML